MRLQDIVNMMGNYLELGIGLLLIVSVLLFIGYWGIYKKICRGKQKIDIKKLFWWFIFIFYIFVVLAVTLLNRSGVWNGKIISFFYSYKEAWISASESAWRNIILNILMFVPLGFWLPLGQKRFRASWKTYLAGLFLASGIEAFQLVFSLGIVEVADIFNNTLGTMIGYGAYKIVEYIVLLYKKEITNVRKLCVCQIPLVLAICMFAGIFFAYQKQELGNLSIECISPYSKDTLEIVVNEEYSKNNETAMVYKTNILTVEETEAFATSFMENLGTTLDKSRNDIYDDTAVYWSQGNNTYSMWIDYKGGTYHMTDFATSFPDEGEEQPQQVKNASKEDILKALLEYGIEVPEEASFSYEPDTGYIFSVERVEKNGVLYDGELICDYYDNGKFANIRNNIRELKPYKMFEISSQQDASEKILEGKFVSFLNLDEVIELGQVEIDYMMDTKGFFQPIYTFHIDLHGEEQSIQVPAIIK